MINRNAIFLSVALGAVTCNALSRGRHGPSVGDYSLSALLRTHLENSRAGLLEYFEGVVKQHETNLGVPSRQMDYFEDLAKHTDGCDDADLVATVLKPNFDRRGQKGAIVDIGANIGYTSSRLLEVFGGLDNHRWGKFHGVAGVRCKDFGPTIELYAFEPSPATFGIFHQRWSESQWNIHHKVHMVNAAVSNQSGKTTFYTKNGGDENGSFDPQNPLNMAGSTRVGETVNVTSLDDFFPSPEKELFLVKVDTEGYDPLVLRGMKKLLAQKQVKFIVFEYNRKWSQVKHGISLRDVTSELYETGYHCFLITKEALVPLSGEWWQSSYEFYRWSNVFCGQSGDHDLFDSYVGFGTNANTLSYALAELAHFAPPAAASSAAPAAAAAAAAAKVSISKRVQE